MSKAFLKTLFSPLTNFYEPFHRGGKTPKKGGEKIK